MNHSRVNVVGHKAVGHEPAQPLIQIPNLPSNRKRKSG